MPSAALRRPPGPPRASTGAAPMPHAARSVSPRADRTPISAMRSTRGRLGADPLGTLHERLELGPGDLRVDATAQPAVGRADDLLGPDDVDEPPDAISHEIGVLDHVGGVADD